MNENISFNIRESADHNLFSIEIYRNSGYIDSMHPMKYEELLILKAFLDKYIWEKHNEGF